MPMRQNIFIFQMYYYVVVLFIEEEMVEIASSRWFLHSTNVQRNDLVKCQWPQKDASTKAKKHIAPENAWSTARVKVLAKTADYDNARLKLSMAEDTDTIESDPASQPLKRKRNSPVRYSPGSTQSDGEFWVEKGRCQYGPLGIKPDTNELPEPPISPLLLKGKAVKQSKQPPWSRAATTPSQTFSGTSERKRKKNTNSTGTQPTNPKITKVPIQFAPNTTTPTQ
uniref:Uncharacterized protein n=1 Tax=Cacopsylla melanoneura TaxID=428564 RepID=A0A8D8SGI4_9HEMI